jgi:hypothetical protein
MSDNLPQNICYSATLSTVLATLAHEEVVAWCGVTIAVGSSIFSWGLSRYHRYRYARREEDRADRREALEDIRSLAKIQTELRIRQDDIRKELAEIVQLIEKTRWKMEEE